jgi:hypothetical protein
MLGGTDASSPQATSSRAMTSEIRTEQSMTDNVPSEATASRRDPMMVAVTVILLVVLLAGFGVGAWWANARWGRHAMVVTGVSAIKALIEGDADGLAAVSNDTVRAQLDQKTRNAMRDSGILVDFTETLWNGDSVTIKTQNGMGDGALIAGPSTDGKDVVTYRTMGGIGFTDGAVSLARTSRGWIVTGIAVKASQLPTASAGGTGSVEPSAAP